MNQNLNLTVSIAVIQIAAILFLHMKNMRNLHIQMNLFDAIMRLIGGMLNSYSTNVVTIQLIPIIHHFGVTK